MFRSKSLQGLIAGLCLITAAACGSSSGGSSGGSANPTAPSVAAPMNLAGAWSGKFIFTKSDGTPDPNPGIVAWAATQSGSSLTGPLTLTINDEGRSEPESYQGTLSGTLSGSQLTLAFSLPAGTFAEVPACAITGSGTATPTTSAITSSLTINFGAACMGTVSDRPTEVDQLQLTK